MAAGQGGFPVVTVGRPGACPCLATGLMDTSARKHTYVHTFRSMCFLSGHCIRAGSIQAIQTLKPPNETSPIPFHSILAKWQMPGAVGLSTWGGALGKGLN